MLNSEQSVHMILPYTWTTGFGNICQVDSKWIFDQWIRDHSVLQYYIITVITEHSVNKAHDHWHVILMHDVKLVFALLACWYWLCWNVALYRMADDFEEHSTRALRNPEKHMSNPVNAFLAVKRFTSDWDHVVQTYIRNNYTEGKAYLL